LNRLLRLYSWLSVLAAASFVSLPAIAQLSPIERATAEALFQEGVALMDQGDLAQACDKFAGTLEIEQGVGTMLHLADCYDKLGRTASSWALFEEVAARAQVSGDTTRAEIALARAAHLKSRLSLVYLRITPPVHPSGRATPVIVELGGARIPEAMWNSPVPVDPGPQPVRIAAEGYQPWTQTIDVPAGPAQLRVIAPELQPVAPRPTPASARVSGPTAPLAPLDSPPARSGSSLRLAGYVTGALGLIGLGVAGYFGYEAYQSQQESLQHCRISDSNACTPSGVAHRQEAQRFARAANVAAIAGGGGLLIGTTLIIVSPSAGGPAPDESRAGLVPLSGIISVRKVW
jgi:hypothetical protein